MPTKQGELKQTKKTPYKDFDLPTIFFILFFLLQKCVFISIDMVFKDRTGIE